MSSIDQLLQRGWQLHQAGDVESARHCYEQALSAAPEHADALVYLGIALFDQRRFHDSVQAYRQALSIRGDFPIAWNNLGNSLRMLGEIEEADACFDAALRQQPGYLSALKNRGTLWVWSGQIERGLGWYEQGLQLDPENAELHRNLGVIRLLLGDYEVGWREYRWRWRMPGMHRPQVPAPIWQGESLRNKAILIYPEQGLGDAIHFVRVASALKRRGARVLMRCSGRMLPLFTSAPCIDQLVLETAIPPVVDYQTSMIDVLDILYGETGQIEWGSELFEESAHPRETAPSETAHSPGRGDMGRAVSGSRGTGYLTVSAALIEYWKQWLDPRTKVRRVGVNWQGNPNHHADVYRSVPLEVLRPLTMIPGIELINLQFGHGSEQLDRCDFGHKILRLPDHVDTDGGAFTDTTAILRNLDCVVTTDTAIAHLAGAVGTPVAMMLGRVPDWRWQLEGETTPWYPTMTLIRQRELGSWEDVVAKVCQYLAGRM